MRKKHENGKPRAPSSAYLLFVRTCRDELRRKYPELTVDYNVISKKCSERWKGMTEQEKKRFHDMIEVQRQRYKSEMEVYEREQQLKVEQPSIVSTPVLIAPKKVIRKREKKEKDPLAPKKPLSAYFLFCADERPKIMSSQSGLGVSDVSKELGLRWKQASAELKSKYEKTASERRDIYRAELALYKSQHSPESEAEFSTVHNETVGH